MLAIGQITLVIHRPDIVVWSAIDVTKFDRSNLVALSISVSAAALTPRCSGDVAATEIPPPLFPPTMHLMMLQAGCTFPVTSYQYQLPLCCTYSRLPHDLKTPS